MGERLITKTLSEKDWDLVTSALMGHSVTITSTCLTCKEVMPEDSYNRDMKESDRLVYLVNVLNGKNEYDQLKQNRKDEIKNLFRCNEGGVTEWCIAKDKKQAYEFMKCAWGESTMKEYEDEYLEDNTELSLDDFIEDFFTVEEADKDFTMWVDENNKTTKKVSEWLKDVDISPSWFGAENY